MNLFARLSLSFLAAPALVLPIAAFAATTTAMAGNPLHCVYEGRMDIQDASIPVPLAVQLRQTEEIEQITTPSGTYSQNRVDGSFVVDEEGGPYKFARVEFDFETGEIDLRYSRAASPDAAASLRLNGHLRPDGSIDGTVYSGLVGHIGTFVLRQSPGAVLKARPKYVGSWTGSGTLVATGAARSVRLILAGTQAIVVNPDSMELGFSLAKTGTFLVNGTSFPFSRVMFDYLRHKLLMINDGAGGSVDSTLQATVNPETGEVEGFLTGVYTGRSLEFKLPRDAGGPL